MLRTGDRNGRDNLRVWIVRVKREWISSADLQRHDVVGRDALEHGHHVVVGEAKDALVVHVHEDVA